MNEQSERMKVASDTLLSALRDLLYPNCTLYLIWHYLQQGDVQAARDEYARGYDKIFVERKLVERLLSDNML